MPLNRLRIRALVSTLSPRFHPYRSGQGRRFLHSV